MLLLAACLLPLSVEAMVRHYKFNVVLKNATRLCSTKPIVTINGKFPGPTIYAREDCYYHAHILWLRATVHGALVILPKLGVPYPFPKPNMEQVIILSEWWKSDTEAVINEALKSGLAPNVSDAHTINGHPGPIQGCVLHKSSFFKIAGHELTVVEVDAVYTKPFKTDTILIAPGQTTNVLLTTKHETGKYLVAASPFMEAPIAVDNKTDTATLHYLGTLVPLRIDHNLLFTVSLSVNPCATCVNNSRVVADINNVTFVMPKISLLQAHFLKIKGVFTDDFPGNPPVTMKGTRVYRLAYNSTVQLVLQDTGMITPENHPIHLHGFNFFVVDAKKFNLVDPVEKNIVGVPAGGWTAIRFRADKPEITKMCAPPSYLASLTHDFFMHWHLEIHTTWGLKMAFVVDNGKGPNESLLPPPSDLPKC
ncbi:hypothetical protein AAZX31_06G266000 [Glycine max]